MHKIDLTIENAQTIITHNKCLERIIKDIVAEVMSLEKFKYAVEVSVTFVDNDRIREINREYRDKDTITDVLSFPMLEFDENHCIIDDYNIGDYNYDADELMLGDIVLSLQKAKEQAETYGHSFEREVGFLTAHSMLHLLGYDHMNESETKVMREKEEFTLEKLGLTR